MENKNSRTDPLTWMRVDRVLGEHGFGQDTPQPGRSLRGGWKRGDGGNGTRGAQETAVEAGAWEASYREEMLQKMEGRLGESHRGKCAGDRPGEGRADGGRGTATFGLEVRELAKRAKTDPGKLALA